MLSFVLLVFNIQVSNCFNNKRAYKYESNRREWPEEILDDSGWSGESERSRNTADTSGKTHAIWYQPWPYEIRHVQTCPDASRAAMPVKLVRTSDKSNAVMALSSRAWILGNRICAIVLLALQFEINTLYHFHNCVKVLKWNVKLTFLFKV